jgi:hypothetical protein
MHGGIGRSVETIETIAKLDRPITNFESDAVSDILWSDPTTDIEEFGSSTRGVGHVFGEVAISRSLNNEGLELLIRGHQSQIEGFSHQLSEKVLTVFSASNYCNRLGNKGGIAIARKTRLGAHVLSKSFPPLEWVFRSEATFLASTDLYSVAIEPEKIMAIRAKPHRLPHLIQTKWLDAAAAVYTPRPRTETVQKRSPKSLKRASAPISRSLGSSSVAVLPTFLLDQFSSKIRKRRGLLIVDM